MNSIINVMSPVKAYYTGVYWSRILSLPLYYYTLAIIYNGHLLIFSPFANHIVIKYMLFLTLYLINLHYAIMIADSLHFPLLSHCSIYVVPASLLINSHCVIIIMPYFNYNVFSNYDSLYFQTMIHFTFKQ